MGAHRSPHPANRRRTKCPLGKTTPIRKPYNTATPTRVRCSPSSLCRGRREIELRACFLCEHAGSRKLIRAIIASRVLTLTALALGLPAHLFIRNARHHRGGPVYINARELRQGAVRRLMCVDRDFGGRLSDSLAARQARVEGGSRRVVLASRLSCSCLQQA
jgi:hypothetical protein